MLPDYANSGGRGKSKKLNVDKIGRPRKLTVDGEYRSGVNITEEIKLQFEHGINKYYRKANGYSLKYVYHFILRDFIQIVIKRMVTSNIGFGNRIVFLLTTSFIIGLKVGRS